MSKAPPIPAELLEWLEELFPDRLPEGETSTATLHLRIGEQRVVRRLRAEYKRQTEPTYSE